MAIIDGTTVSVLKAQRGGGVQRLLLNVNGAVLGFEFQGLADIKRFVNESTLDDAVRALLLAAYDRAGDTLNGAVFDALEGKTFQVQTRVVQQ